MTPDQVSNILLENKFCIWIIANFAKRCLRLHWYFDNMEVLTVWLTHAAFLFFPAGNKSLGLIKCFLTLNGRVYCFLSWFKKKKKEKNKKKPQKNADFYCNKIWEE